MGSFLKTFDPIQLLNNVKTKIIYILARSKSRISAWNKRDISIEEPASDMLLPHRKPTLPVKAVQFLGRLELLLPAFHVVHQQGPYLRNEIIYVTFKNVLITIC